MPEPVSCTDRSNIAPGGKASVRQRELRIGGSTIRGARESVPWLSMAWAPLVQKFITTCCSSVGSAMMAAWPASSTTSIATVAGSDARNSSTASATTGSAAISLGRRSLRRLNVRILSITACARLPAVTIPCTCCSALLPPADARQRHFGIAENGAEDIVELVRDTAGERADRFEPLRLVQPRLQLLAIDLAALRARSHSQKSRRPFARARCRRPANTSGPPRHRA